MRRALIPFVAFLALLLAACGGGEEAVAPTATAPAVAGSEAVSFLTEDGITIRGHLFGSGETAVVLSHMRPNDQQAWFGFARVLAGQGFAALTYDFRGYGETSGEEDLGLIDRDLAAAVDFLRARGFQRIFLIGASMGGTASLVVAAREEVAGVVAVSAPASFEGLDAEAVMAQVSEPKLFIASLGDQSAYNSLQGLMAKAREPKESRTFDGNAHGTRILEGEYAAQFRDAVIQFLRETGG